MTYQQWVDKVGFKKAAEVLGHPVSTLRMWYSMQRFPRPAQMVSILDKTAGVIDVEQWTRRFAESQKVVGEATAC